MNLSLNFRKGVEYYTLASMRIQKPLMMTLLMKLCKNKKVFNQGQSVAEPQECEGLPADLFCGLDTQFYCPQVELYLNYTKLPGNLI